MAVLVLELRIIDHEWHAQLQPSSFSFSSSSPSSFLSFFFFLFFLCFCSPLVAFVSTACVRLQQHRCHLLSRIQRWRLSSGRCFSLSCCCSFLLVPSRPSTYPELLPGTSHRWVKSRPIFFSCFCYYDHAVWFFVFVTVFWLFVGLLLCCGWIQLLYCLCRCLWVEVFSVCSSTSKGKLFSRSVFCCIASVSVVRVLFRSSCSDEDFASSVDLLCTSISPSTMKRAFVVCTRSLIRLSLASRSAICC